MAAPTAEAAPANRIADSPRRDRHRPLGAVRRGVREIGLALITVGRDHPAVRRLPVVGHGHRRSAQPGVAQAGVQHRHRHATAAATTPPSAPAAGPPSAQPGPGWRHRPPGHPEDPPRRVRGRRASPRTTCGAGPGTTRRPSCPARTATPPSPATAPPTARRSSPSTSCRSATRSDSPTPPAGRSCTRCRSRPRWSARATSPSSIPPRSPS